MITMEVGGVPSEICPAVSFWNPCCEEVHTCLELLLVVRTGRVCMIQKLSSEDRNGVRIGQVEKGAAHKDRKCYVQEIVSSEKHFEIYGATYLCARPLKFEENGARGPCGLILFWSCIQGQS